jgi:hypothetical protein
MMIAALSRPKADESQNGDGYFLAGLDADNTVIQKMISGPELELKALEVTDFDKALLAVVDGVGHGAEAAKTTEKVLECIDRYCGVDLDILVKQCHQTAMYSRGVTLGIALADRKSSRVDFIGVGSVGMQLGTPRGSGTAVHRFVANNGIVGYNLPARLLSFSHQYTPEDTLVVYSDGISNKFNLRGISGLRVTSVADLAESILGEFGSTADDVTVVVAR